MKSLTLPLSVLLTGYFRFNNYAESYTPKQGMDIRAGLSDGNGIDFVTPEYTGSGNQYQVYYKDGSSLCFGKDENIMVLI